MSLHPGTGTDSDRVTRLTTYCREHAPSVANVVSTGTLCHLTYMTLLTLTYSRNHLKLFCLIVRTDLLLLLYGAPGRFMERRLTNPSLYLFLYCIWNSLPDSIKLTTDINRFKSFKKKLIYSISRFHILLAPLDNL